MYPGGSFRRNQGGDKGASGLYLRRGCGIDDEQHILWSKKVCWQSGCQSPAKGKIRGTKRRDGCGRDP